MIEAQQIAKKQGKIRFTGISTHDTPEMAPWMAQKGVFDVLLTMYNFSMEPNVAEAIAAAAKSWNGRRGHEGDGRRLPQGSAQAPRYTKSCRSPGASLAHVEVGHPRPAYRHHHPQHH